MRNEMKWQAKAVNTFPYGHPKGLKLLVAIVAGRYESHYDSFIMSNAGWKVKSI